MLKKKAEQGSQQPTQQTQIQPKISKKEDLTTKLKDINDDLINTVKQKDIFTEGQRDELEDAIDALFKDSKKPSAPYTTRQYALNLDEETKHEIEKHLNRPRISFEGDEEDALVDHINIQMAKMPPESRFTFRPSSCVSVFQIRKYFINFISTRRN